MRKILVILFFAIVAFSGKAFAQPIDSTTLNGASITGTVTLNNTTVYLMKGFNVVRNGGKIVIPAGALIKGDKATTGTLIVLRGGKIIAEGTSLKPIVFTSRFNAGSRNPGDWGGLVILGRSGINTPTGLDSARIEGFPPELEQYWYGGQPVINDDSSGVLKYVRLEYPGVNLTGVSGNEINGLTLGGVGNKTVLEHIQVSYSGDDAYEWFGGNVNAKWLIALGTVDDDFDCDNGHRGKVQFGLAIRDTSKSDVSASHMFEIDNNANSPSNFNSPRTRTMFSNMTCIGPKMTNASVVGPFYLRAAHIRRNMLACLYNSVLTGCNVGIRFDGTGVMNASLGDTIQVRNNIFSGFSTAIGDTAAHGTVNFNAVTWLNTGSFSNRTLTQPTDVNLTSPYAFYGASGTNALPGVNWYVPQAGSAALTGADFTNPNLAGFTTTTYVGAFGTSDNWTAGWSNFNPLNYTAVPNAISQISDLVPNTFKLNQNYPNPFNPATTINFSIPKNGFVTLRIFDVTGREVANLVNQNLIAGEYKYDFNAANLNSGVYFYTLKGENFSETKKMMLIK